MERNRVHPTLTTLATSLAAIPAHVVGVVQGSGVYTQLRRDWRNPQSRRDSVRSEEVNEVVVNEVVNAHQVMHQLTHIAWFSATHTITPALTTPLTTPPQTVYRDTHKEVHKQAREHTSPTHKLHVHRYNHSRYSIFYERGWVLKAKPMQRCWRDAACKRLEETRTLEFCCTQRPPKTHPLIPSAVRAFTAELSFRSPLRLRAQVSGERPDRDITSHLSVYRTATASA